MQQFELQKFRWKNSFYQFGMESICEIALNKRIKIHSIFSLLNCIKSIRYHSCYCSIFSFAFLPFFVNFFVFFFCEIRCSEQFNLFWLCIWLRKSIFPLLPCTIFSFGLLQQMKRTRKCVYKNGASIVHCTVHSKEQFWAFFSLSFFFEFLAEWT